MYSHEIFFRHAEIFKLGCFVQRYSNQGILCRNIGQLQLRVTQSWAAVYLDHTKPNTMDILFFSSRNSPNNGVNLKCCMIRVKFLISQCKKKSFGGICAELLLFRAERLPCGPPLIPHSCAESFLGVVQKYSFL